MFSTDIIIPMMIFAIPIVAIVGGITAGIVKSISQHRMMELAQRERIAAIERGIDLEKLPPPILRGEEFGLSPQEFSRRQSQGLMIGGAVTLAAGIGLGIFLNQVSGEDHGVWTIGLIPGAIGVALLVSGYLVRYRNGNGHPPARPTA